MAGVQAGRKARLSELIFMVSSPLTLKPVWPSLGRQCRPMNNQAPMAWTRFIGFADQGVAGTPSATGGNPNQYYLFAWKIIFILWVILLRSRKGMDGGLGVPGEGRQGGGPGKSRTRPGGVCHQNPAAGVGSGGCMPVVNHHTVTTLF